LTPPSKKFGPPPSVATAHVALFFTYGAKTNEVSLLSPVDEHKSPGQRLVDGLTQVDDSVMMTVLITEAGRITDRLEVLHAIASGQQTLWARLVVGRDGDIEVRIDNALAEARQQATVLRQLLNDIQRQRSAQPPAGPPDDDLAGL
jgi:hypothetical protein